MPRAQKIQTNFTAGEISPRLLGRVDLARYQNGVRIMENFHVILQGGASRSHGLRYIAPAKFPGKKARLVSFVFSALQAYVLEFGDLYMRVFKDEGQVLALSVPYEIVTPYAETDLPDLNWVQSADTAFLVHPSRLVQKLSRAGHAAWKLAPFKFLVEPHDELGAKPSADLSLAATTGAGIAVAATAAVFEAADVGRQITSGDGIGTIKTYVDTSHVTMDILDDFPSTAPGAGNWTLTESPKTGLTPSAVGTEGATITLTLDAAGWKNVPTTDVGRYVHLNGGVVEITTFTSPTAVSGLVRSPLLNATKAESAAWSLETKVWNATNGYPRAVTLFEQRLVLAGTTAFPNRVWASRTGRYNDFTTGSADNDALDLDMVSDQQNPIMQLAPLRALLPLTYGGEFSVRGGVEKPLTASNNQVRPESQYGIRNVRPVRVGTELLFVQRAGRKIRSSSYSVYQDGFVSPDRTKLSEHITESGITAMWYAQEPDSLVYMVRADGQLVSLTINTEEDAQVLGFARRVTDGAYESGCAIPYKEADQSWVLVKRTINGAVVRNIELLDPTRNTDSHVTGLKAPIVITSMAWAAGVMTVATASPHGLAAGSTARIRFSSPSVLNGDKDCIAGTAGSTIKFNLETNPGLVLIYGTVTPLSSTWAGLGHMEAKTVDVVADGVVFPQQAVVGAQITLPRAVESVEIGLHYDSTLELLNPELPMADGTAQGRPVSVSEMTVRLYQSMGGQVNGEVLPFRKWGPGILDQPLAMFTGDKRVNLIGWNRETTIPIVQDQPLPMHILAAIYKVSVGD